jgi:hypothetical protein
MYRYLTFDEMVVDLIQSLKLETKKAIANLDERDLVSLHSTLGRAVRNNYRLWDEDHPLTTKWHKEPHNRHIVSDIDFSEDHPDYVSSELIKEVWHCVQYLRTNP